MRRASLLLALFVALAVLHTWPLASNPAGLSRLDNDDTALNVFVVAWIAHIVPRDPLALFDAPIFFPERYTLAYSEHMLVPSLMGAPLIWAGVSPVTAYNVLVLAGFALSGWSMALVLRRWTGSTLAGIAAGMLYAFNAHLLTRLVHLQALHLEFLPFALLALDRVLAGPRGSNPGMRPTSSAPSASSVALLASAFVLQSLCSNYTLVFLAVALAVAALARADEWLAPLGRDTVVALALAAVVAAIVLTPFLWPYYVVSRQQGLSRPIEEVALYSASWRDYLATGGRLHHDWWSWQWFEGRTPLFPGVVGLGTACAGFLAPAVRRDRRVRMTVAFGVVGLALSLGPALPGFGWLHAHVPLFEGIRAAARWGLLFLIAVAVLAGFAVEAAERQWGTLGWWPAAAAAILGAITLEALRAPLSFAAVPRIPALYDTLAHQPGAVAELPLFAGPSVSENARYLLNATRHFRPLVNGYSGFETGDFRRRAERWRAFPQPQVLDEMAALGVTHVIVHGDTLDPGQVRAAAESTRLEPVAEDGARRMYRLRR